VLGVLRAVGYIVMNPGHISNYCSLIYISKLQCWSSWALQPRVGLGLLWAFITNDFLQGGVVSPTPNTQPGGPGLRIYIPWRQDGPAIPPGTGYPFQSPLTTCMGYCGAILILRPLHGDSRVHTLFKTLITCRLVLIALCQFSLEINK
jgi:hypothetical protein